MSAEWWFVGGPGNSSWARVAFLAAFGGDPLKSTQDPAYRRARGLPIEALSLVGVPADAMPEVGHHTFTIMPAPSPPAPTPAASDGSYTEAITRGDRAAVVLETCGRDGGNPFAPTSALQGNAMLWGPYPAPKDEGGTASRDFILCLAGVTN